MRYLYPERESPRLPGFDYLQPGAYFVTAVTGHRACLFGDASDPTALSDAGMMVQSTLRRIPARFSTITLDEHVVMPNHVHAILILSNDARHERHSVPVAFGDFKSYVVREYRRGVETLGWTRYEGSLWQRSYFDHVIRDENSLHDIREYIYNNPLKWTLDREHPVYGRPQRAAPTSR
jgi:putative transposase